MLPAVSVFEVEALTAFASGTRYPDRVRSTRSRSRSCKAPVQYQVLSVDLFAMIGKSMILFDERWGQDIKLGFGVRSCGALEEVPNVKEHNDQIIECTESFGFEGKNSITIRCVATLDLSRTTPSLASRSSSDLAPRNMSCEILSRYSSGRAVTTRLVVLL